MVVTLSFCMIYLCCTLQILCSSAVVQNVPVRLPPCRLFGGLQRVPQLFSSRLWPCYNDGCSDSDSKVFQPGVLWRMVASVIG